MKLIRFDPYDAPRDLTAEERTLLDERMARGECFSKAGIRTPVAFVHLTVMLAVLSLHGSYARAGLWFLRMALYKAGQRAVDRARAFWYLTVLRQKPVDLDEMLENEEDEAFLDELADAMREEVRP